MSFSRYINHHWQVWSISASRWTLSWVTLSWKLKWHSLGWVKTPYKFWHNHLILDLSHECTVWKSWGPNSSHWHWGSNLIESYAECFLLNQLCFIFHILWRDGYCDWFSGSGCCLPWFWVYETSLLCISAKEIKWDQPIQFETHQSGRIWPSDTDRIFLIISDSNSLCIQQSYEKICQDNIKVFRYPLDPKGTLLCLTNFYDKKS
jgi:hypothetical protein